MGIGAAGRCSAVESLDSPFSLLSRFVLLVPFFVVCIDNVLGYMQGERQVVAFLSFKVREDIVQVPSTEGVGCQSFLPDFVVSQPHVDL